MDKSIINKGGRPPKKSKRQEQLAVMCTLLERKIIKQRAQEVDLTVSEFLREAGMEGKIIKKTFPKEILEFTGKLNHLAANINQIAKKRNRDDELNALERAKLKSLAEDIKNLTIEIKNYLK